jgi:ketosteroid isomerase-like protein
VQTVQGLREQACATLEAADRALAAATALHGSAAAFPAVAAPDALLLAEGVYAPRGPEAIRRHLTAAPLEKDGTLSWEPLRWGVSADGRVGFSVGGGTVRAAAREGGAATPAVARHFKYLSAWRRGPDGAWRLSATVPFLDAMALRPLPEDLPACHAQPAPTAAPPPSAPPTAALARMLETDRAFSGMAMAQGMGPAFLHYAAPDVTLPGGPGLYGKERMAKAPSRPSPPGLVSWVPTYGEAAGTGDLGWTVGAATFRAPSPGGKETYTKYLSIWRLQADGTYRYVSDHGTPRPGPDGV